MEDSYHRVVDRIRISVTSRCDLKCTYCHAEGQDCNGNDLELWEIRKLLEAASSLGIRTIKITGGEPLARGDIVDVVATAAEYMDDVSITTNGTRLAELASELCGAGLSRVNVSLPSLNNDTYREITGSDKLGSVIEGIDAAIANDLTPLKLNVVLLRGLNDGELPRLMDFSAGRDAMLQLIELMSLPSLDASYHDAHYFDMATLEKNIAGLSPEAVSRNFHHRMRYRVPLPLNGGPAPPQAPCCWVEVVRPEDNPSFCANCTRIRITADGKAKPCLMSPDTVDLRPLIPRGRGAVIAGLESTVNLRKPYWS